MAKGQGHTRLYQASVSCRRATSPIAMIAGLSTPAAAEAASLSDVITTRCAAVNIGYRPTVETNAATLHVEAHLVDFHEEVYGQEMELLFVRKLREEQKFASLEALKAQVEQDVAAARTAEKV